MVLYGKEDRELNLLMEAPHRRVGRRGFLQVAALLGAAGVAGYAGGTVAGLGDDGPEAVAAQPLPGNRRQERLLSIYNWSDYIDDRTIPLFQALTNIRVNHDVYSSNEDLLAKLRAGPTSYDIIVPTSDFIPTYRSLDLSGVIRCRRWVAPAASRCGSGTARSSKSRTVSRVRSISRWRSSSGCRQRDTDPQPSSSSRPPNGTRGQPPLPGTRPCRRRVGVRNLVKRAGGVVGA
jgi:hypothetical protein